MYAKNNYAKVANFFKNNILGKIIEKKFPDIYDFTLKNIAKIWGRKVSLKFTKTFVWDALTDGFTVYGFISNFTSWGAIIAYFFDIVDGNPNSYIRVKVK